MTYWLDIRHHLETQADPDLAELTPADREAAGPSAFARALARSRPKWHADGACLEHPELDWFAGRAVDQAEAVNVCRRCLVVDECLTFALEHGELGVWGGTTEAERGELRKAA
jgi:WhiB family redox-sensing transcriptional regulator